VTDRIRYQPLKPDRISDRTMFRLLLSYMERLPEAMVEDEVEQPDGTMEIGM